MGAKEGLIGYRGVCTPRTTVYNVEVKRAPWCSHRDNACRQFCDRGRKADERMIRATRADC